MEEGLSEWQKFAAGTVTLIVGVGTALKYFMGAVSLERDKHHAELVLGLERIQQSQAQTQLDLDQERCDADVERRARMAMEIECHTWRIRAVNAEAECQIVKDKTGATTPLPEEVKVELQSKGIEII